MSDAPSEAAPKKKSKLLFIIIGLVVVLAAAAGGLVFLKAKKGDEDGEGKHAKKEMKPPVFIQLEDFLVNLPGRGGEHFLQARVVLRAADAATESKIKNFTPLIRDRLLTVLSQRPMDVLATVDGKAQLTRDMGLVINAILDPQITASYVLTRDPTGGELRNLERLGVISKSVLAQAKPGGGSGPGGEITEMDLPVQQVLFNSFIMQ